MRRRGDREPPWIARKGSRRYHTEPPCNQLIPAEYRPNKSPPPKAGKYAKIRSKKKFHRHPPYTVATYVGCAT